MFIIDLSGAEGRDPFQDYINLKKELQLFKWELIEKPRVIAANKLDLPFAEKNLQHFRSRISDAPVFPISAVTGEGISPLLEELHSIIQKNLSNDPEEGYTVRIGEMESTYYFYDIAGYKEE